MHGIPQAASLHSTAGRATYTARSRRRRFTTCNPVEECRLLPLQRLPASFHHQGIIGNNYVSGTTLDKVWTYYLIDRKLRFLMMDAIERIEVALHIRIAYHHTAGQSPFAYANPSYFPKWKECMQSLERVWMQRNKQGDFVPSS